MTAANATTNLVDVVSVFQPVACTKHCGTGFVAPDAAPCTAFAESAMRSVHLCNRVASPASSTADERGSENKFGALLGSCLHFNILPTLWNLTTMDHERLVEREVQQELTDLLLEMILFIGRVFICERGECLCYMADEPVDYFKARSIRDTRRKWLAENQLHADWASHRVAI